ncbi:MAG TPA: hypothetical protein ENI23_15055 [bacterium]|nr:hypothetical protein [bacterium]
MSSEIQEFRWKTPKSKRWTQWHSARLNGVQIPICGVSEPLPGYSVETRAFDPKDSEGCPRCRRSLIKQNRLQISSERSYQEFIRKLNCTDWDQIVQFYTWVNSGKTPDRSYLDQKQRIWQKSCFDWFMTLDSQRAAYFVDWSFNNLV